MKFKCCIPNPNIKVFRVIDIYNAVTNGHYAKKILPNPSRHVLLNMTHGYKSESERTFKCDIMNWRGFLRRFRDAD